jgi:tetratricopeptide (TPR) repeat protein
VLDGLPLALATAGAYLSQVPTTLSEYLCHYNASWLKLQKTAPELTEYEDRMLYSTWQISYDHVQQRNENSAKLLRLWAYLDNQDVWFELFRHTDQDDPVWIREITEDELSFNAAVRVLCDHGLAEVDQSPSELTESRGYSMHACVHAWTMHVLNQKWDGNLARLALKFVGSHVPGREKNKWWATQRRLLQHANRCSNMIIKDSIAGEHMDWAMHMLAYLYEFQGKLDEAEKMYERALVGNEKAWGPDHTSTLDTVNNFGNLYKSQGKLDKAEKMYERALVGKEKAWGPVHTSTLDTVNNLGNLYADQGKLDKAEKMYQRALVGNEKAWGPDHTSTLDTVNNLGLLYVDQDKLDEAEKMFERALVGKEKALGPDHTSTLDTVNNLGALRRSQGKLDEAEKLYERALVGKEKVWGPDHTSTLVTVNNLGNLYKSQGKLDEAEKMYDRALRGYEIALGSVQVLTYVHALNTMQNSALLLSSTGRADEATRLYKRAQQGVEVVFGRASSRYEELTAALESLRVDEAS